MSSSFIAQVMEPGGGVMLLPFVRGVIAILLLLTSTAAIVGVARLHMVILTFLSGGLLLSLSFFESEFKKVRANNSDTRTKTTNVAASNKEASKTD